MKSITEYLNFTATKYPDKIAASDVSGSITFEALKNKSEKYACNMLEYTNSNSPIVILADKSIDVLISFMAAAYAGCYYVLIEPSHPIGRINSILETLGSTIIITNEKHIGVIDSLNFTGNVKLFSELEILDIDLKKLKNISENRLDTDPLYVIFTSGSTGIPKGVVVSHRAVIDFIDVFVETFNITSDDIIANQAPFDFDVSVKDIYSMIKTGAEIDILPKSYFSFPTKLMDRLHDKKATILIWAVSALNIVSIMKGLEYKLPQSLNKIMFSGEVMPIKHLNYWQEYLPNAMYVNLYGPSEVTCNSNYYILDRKFEIGEVLPLGKTFKNRRVFLLDENDDIITISDQLGELCVSGTSLALGYFNDEAKTKSCFVQNPANKKWIDLIYKTGDLAKYGKDGNLYYVARKDFQVKHMGHRIELLEIEVALNTINEIERCCVLYDNIKTKIIAVYQGDIDKKSITNSLIDKLPRFMIPMVYHKFDEIELSPNGKIDRNKIRNQIIGKQEG